MSDQNEPLIPNLGLLILDVQSGFLKALPNPDSFLNRVAFVSESCRLFNLPAMITEQRPEVLGATVETVSALLPNAPHVAKLGFSAFTEPAVNDWIEEHSIHHMLMVGLEIPICVYQTALDAINRDVEVSILSDAVTARRENDAQAVLASLRIHGAHVLPSETIFYSILRDSVHPAFKEFTQLVKKYSDK